MTPPSLSAPDPTAEDIAAVRDRLWNGGPRHDNGFNAALAALDRLRLRLAATEVQRDIARHAADVRGDINEGWKERLAATEAEREAWRRSFGERDANAMTYLRRAEASEARSAKLEAALREIEKDASLLGGLVQFSDSPQGTLIGEIRKTARAALVSSPAAEGEA